MTEPDIIFFIRSQLSPPAYRCRPLSARAVNAAYWRPRVGSGRRRASVSHRVRHWPLITGVTGPLVPPISRSPGRVTPANSTARGFLRPARPTGGGEFNRGRGRDCARTISPRAAAAPLLVGGGVRPQSSRSRLLSGRCVVLRLTAQTVHQSRQGGTRRCS